MDVQAINKYNRISTAKVAEVTREIQGLSVSHALDTLRFIPRKAARIVEKTLKSALANATNNADLRSETLVVKIAAAEKGPVFKRFKASARGMASPRLRRTSHIRIVLSDEGGKRSQRNGKQRGRMNAAPETASEPKTKPATTE
jgi:large subunit ribosomal protein L22